MSTDDQCRQPLPPTWDEEWRYKKWLEFCQKPHADWPDDGRLIHAAFEAGINAVIPILDAYARASFRYSDECERLRKQVIDLGTISMNAEHELAEALRMQLQPQPGEVRLVPTGECRKAQFGDWVSLCEPVDELYVWRDKEPSDINYDIYRRIVGPEGA